MNGISIISYECKYICICVCPHVYVWGQAFAYIYKLLVCTCTFLFDSVCVCSSIYPLNKDPTFKSCWGYKMYLLKYQKIRQNMAVLLLISKQGPSLLTYINSFPHPKILGAGCLLHQLFILTRLGNWLHKIKWLALGHTVTKWQRRDLTQPDSNAHTLSEAAVDGELRDHGSLMCTSSRLFTAPEPLFT